MKNRKKNNSEEKKASIRVLQHRNNLLREYIRDRMNRLLLVMGTKPLNDNELSYESIIALDPIGIIAESFEQVLDHLRESNRELLTAKNYLQAVFDTAGVCISIVDRDLRILKYNEKQKELLVRGGSRVIGRHCYEVYCGIPSPALNCPVIETLETGRTVFIKEVIKQGRVFQIVTSPLKDRGEVKAVIEVSIDITEKKKAEDAMRHSERLAAIGQLSAGIAHELNNPLGNIIGYTQLLLEDPAFSGISEEHRNKLEIVIEQARVGSGIIRSLLDFSHQRKPVLEGFSFNAAVDRTISLLGKQIRGAKIKLSKREGILPIVEADPSQIEQVVHNIMLNAVHATEGRKGVIEVSTRAKRDSVELEIKDNGEGIRKEHLGKIFDPFFTTKPVGKGTGLGLSICSGIVREHGGSIHVESEPGKGATFIVRLPRRRVGCKGGN